MTLPGVLKFQKIIFLQIWNEHQEVGLQKILIENLKKSSDISTLKNRILEIKKYDGLQGDIIFDKYGDVFREYFIMKVQNSEYKKVN